MDNSIRYRIVTRQCTGKVINRPDYHKSDFTGIFYTVRHEKGESDFGVTPPFEPAFFGRMAQGPNGLMA